MKQLYMPSTGEMSLQGGVWCGRVGVEKLWRVSFEGSGLYGCFQFYNRRLSLFSVDARLVVGGLPDM